MMQKKTPDPARAFALLAFALLWPAACSGGEVDIGAPESEPLVIDGADLWDGTGSPIRVDTVMVIENDRIRAVGPRADVSVPENARRVDARGMTLIPGLINGHAHVGMVRGLVESPSNYDRENIVSQLEQYARYGVTTVLSLGLDYGPMFEVQGPARPEEPPRASVLTAGRGFTGAGGYPAALEHLASVPTQIDAVEEVAPALGELAGQGVDVVKIWVDDHFGRYGKIRPELSAAIIAEAHAQGLPVLAHVFYLEDAKALAGAGVDGLAHNVRDQEVDAGLIDLLLANDTFVLPTLSREESTSLYAEPPAFLDDPFFTRWADPDVIAAIRDPAYGTGVREHVDFRRHQDQFEMAKANLSRLLDAGVRIAFGTDSGPPARFQGYFEHREMELMVDLGVTPGEVLRIATSGTAAALGIAQDYGTLEAGKRADFLLLDESPLEDIRNTRTIRSVWIGGRQLDPD
jgi:imidazolonepropionase-like amidohydrolase